MIRSPTDIPYATAVGRVGAVPVGLVDHEHVGDLQDAGLGRLDRVAHAGGEQHERGVGEAGHLDLGLADADGLHEHNLASGAFQHANRLRGRRGEAAQVAAAGHGPDVDAGIGGVVLHPDPVAENRPAGEGAGRGHRARVTLARAAHQRGYVPGAGPHFAGTRSRRASPWPPPPQSAAAPSPPPRRLSSSARVSASLAPDMPIGWPSAIAPPLTLTLSALTPRSRIDWMATDAKASLISIRSRSSTDSPALPNACRIALAGWDCSELSGPATLPCAPISASHSSPSSSALRLLITTTAHAPSEMGEDVAAVIVPSRVKAGLSLASDSTVVSGRICSSSLTTIGSPRRCGSSTGAISSAKTPFFWAEAARWWLAAPNASCSSRLMFSLAL